MKKIFLKNLFKNSRFRKGMGIALSGLIVANMTGVSAYSFFSSKENRSNRLMVGRESPYLTYLTTDKGLIFATYVKKAENGNMALCMEHIKPAPINHMYTKGEVIDDLAMRHIALSEPNMGTVEEDYYVKQLALNYYQGDVNYITGTLKKGEVYRDKAIDLAEEAIRVRDGLETSPYFVTDADISIASSVNNQFALNGDYYVTDWFNVSHVGDLQTYSVNLKNAPSGVEVLNRNEVVVNQLTASDNRFKLRIHKDNIDKAYNNINVSLTASFNELKPTRYYPDNSNYQILLLMDSYPITKNTNTSINIALDPVGDIKVTKVNEKGEKLSGAIFELQKNGVTIATETTNSLGEIDFNNLEVGSYSLIEKSAPIGHILNSNPININVRAGRITDVIVDNEIIKGRISVTKTDSEINSLLIEDVDFEIYDALGNVVDKITTDANGYAESKLLNYGTYTMKEVKAADGYHINNTVYTVNIAEHNKTYTYDIENDIYKGKIHIVKIDSENEERPVQNAGFDIIAKNVRGIADGTVVEHVVTDEDGFAITKDLRYGEYIVREVDTPPGFWVSNKDYIIDIKQDGKTYVRYIKNDPVEAKIRVIKTDEETRALLPSVKFKIKDKATGDDIVFKEFVGGKIVDKIEFTTDEYGEFTTPQILPKGEYQLVEVESLEGYVLLEPIDFTIDENSPMEDIEVIGKVMTIEAVNHRISGDMRLTKVDMYTKEPLSNIQFSIECVDGFMKGRKFIISTGEDGMIELNDLKYGKYKVTEIKAKEDYVLNEEPVFFNIENNGETVELTFENKPKEGYIKIIKIDSESKKPLKDVEFTIYNENNEEVATLVTDKEGEAKSEELIYGKYKLVETKPLENYVNNTEPIEFEILNDGEIIEKVIENDSKKGDLIFTKIDSSTRKGLCGAVIRITGLDELNEYIDIEFESIDTSNNFRLPVGRYKLKEESAPDGYTKTSKTEKFEIVEDNITEINFENKKIPMCTNPDGTSGPCDIVNKPLTGDDIMFLTGMMIVSIIGLYAINKNRAISNKSRLNDLNNQRVNKK